MSRNVAVVSHSHWDREWYAPFDSYRARLLAMLDGLLDLLEDDPGFAHFHLDGQTALVDDYLELRPHQRSRLEALVRAGRLSVGPWYVLMDEFCVSGETMVRNLQLGLERARALGGAGGSLVGYLPDMFGHVAQMPQLLHLAGIAHAVVWRGVPREVGATAFWWSAPGGATVRAEYLRAGYSNGAFLPADPEALLRRVAAHDRELGAALPPGWPLLLMNGGDHHGPQPSVPAALAGANSQHGCRYVFRHTSLAGFLESAPTEGLGSWTGELRSGSRAPILMGVLSSRVDVKQAAAAAELGLERVAEPLATLWLPPDGWPGALLDRAWIEMVRNSAHDSVCGCSTDEVARAVLSRYDNARAISSEVVQTSAAIAGVATSHAGPLVLNPSPRDRAGLVELHLPGTVAPEGTQQLHAQPSVVVERTCAGRDLASMVAALTAEGHLGALPPSVDATLDDTPAGAVLTIFRETGRRPEPVMAAVMAEAWAVAGADPHRRFTVRVQRPADQRVLARVDVPGWGWAVWPGATGTDPAAAVAVAPGRIDNGLIAVDIDPATGTFRLDGVAGQNLIAHEPDAGDSYNFSAAGIPPVTSPESVSAEVLEAGPLRGIVRVRRTYTWSRGLAGATPTGSATVEVTSDVEVRAGERAVRVTTSFDNPSRDHRVRAVFPLGAPAGHTVAECAFATVRRGRDAEGGPHEEAVPAFPSRRFVTAGALTVTHQGLLEHELVDGGAALAVTLLRATGVIARPSLRSRTVLAGPPVPLRDAQMPGPHTFRYALAPGCADPWGLADDVWTPLVTTDAAGVGHLPDRGRRLALEGAQVSALLRKDGAVHVRVFNPAGVAATVRVPGHSGTLVDLAGEPVRRWEGCFVLGPWEIATARLDAASLD